MGAQGDFLGRPSPVLWFLSSPCCLSPILTTLPHSHISYQPTAKRSRQENPVKWVYS